MHLLKAWNNPNENREVLVYDQFACDNFCLKFIIRLKEEKKKKYLFDIYLMLLFGTDATSCTKNIKKTVLESSS